jgi:hypothetical protein
MGEVMDWMDVTLIVGYVVAAVLVVWVAVDP